MHLEEPDRSKEKIMQTKFHFRVDLMHAETPNVAIAESVVCLENLKQEMNRVCPPGRFKCIQ